MNKLTTRKRRQKKLRHYQAKNAKVCIVIIKSSRNISAQLIDFSIGKVLAVSSTISKDFKENNGGNIAAAKKIGEAIALKASKLGFKKVSFDRSGFKYHGRVKALADGAREGGLEF